LGSFNSYGLSTSSSVPEFWPYFFIKFKIT
jgi:hypothetical protein